MKKASSAKVRRSAKQGRGTSDNDSQAAVPAVNATHDAEKTWTHTSGIKILGVGESSEGERFLRVCVGAKTALLNVDKIAESKSGELKLLTRLGEPLIKPKARAEFIDRAHDEARAEPSFKVATKTGWLDGAFIFPEGLAPTDETNIERYFDWRYARYHRRLHREGSFEGWRALAELCRGKSRLVAGLCLALSGPVCGAFGDEAPGLQLVSEGGKGNTTIGRVVATVWGGDRNPARKIGCGVSCNNTGINFEVLAGAFDQMLLFLDDMHNAGEAELKAIHNVMNGEGRGRSTDALRAEFCTPTLCGANTSLVHIATRIKVRHLIKPLIDRLMEVGLPAGWPYLLEGIRTKEQFRDYGNQLRKGARENFGWAGPLFVKKLDRGLRVNRPVVEAFIDGSHEKYHAAAANTESSGDRDLGRISNKFATLYVTGCLAARFEVLPFTEAEILDALLICHRDHVSFIDQQLGAAAGPAVTATEGPASNVLEMRIPGSAARTKSPFARLKTYLKDNIPDGLIDLRDSATELPEDHDHSMAPGYIGIHDNKIELWFSNDKFEKIAGGKREAQALKKMLANMERLMMWRRGKGPPSNVVKRRIDGLGLHWVVAFRPPQVLRARLPKLKTA